MNDIDQTALEIARAFIPVDVVGQQRANLQVAIIEAIKKHANPKTLADVQPGGRVRLGGLLPEDVAQALAAVNEVANDARHAGNYRVANALVTARVTLSKQLLALSAQPSPGGQDARALLAAEYDAAGSDKRATLIREGRDHAPSTSYALRAIEAALAARQPVGEPVAELREKGKRKVRAVVSQDDLHKILYLIHALKNISNKVWLKHDIPADDYRAATINDAAKVASGAIELLTRAYSALSGARADARVSRSAPGDAWIYADLNELSPHDVALLRDMRDHMAAKTMSLNDWHAFGPPVLDRVLALIDNDHAHRDASPPAQAVDLGTGVKAIAAERERQLQAEGFTRDGDQQYRRGELAKAATAYVQLAAMDLEAGTRNHIAWREPAAVWPWAPEWWKPVDARRDLVRAGALIAAQIDAIDSQAVGNG